MRHGFGELNPDTRVGLTGAAMIPACAFSLLLAGLALHPAHADTIYKWVDRTGQVTYSSTPPPAGAKAEKLDAAPQPSEEDIRQAEERLKRAQEHASDMENKRLEQEAREAESARLRESQKPQPVIVIEQPPNVPLPYYYPYPHAIRPPHPRPPVKPHPQPPVKPHPRPPVKPPPSPLQN